MNELDQLVSAPSATPLDQLVDLSAPNPNAGLSDAAIKNRAASVAFMAPTTEQGMADYEVLVAEAGDGSDQTLGVLQANANAVNQRVDMNAIMSILSDPNVDEQTKINAVSAMQSQARADTFENLTAKALAAESTGENFDEEASRLSTADMLAEFREQREERQSLVNAAVLQRDGADYYWPQAAEMMLTPMGDSIAALRVQQALRADGKAIGFWDTVKAALLPGSSVADMREQLALMPPEERLAATSALLSAIEQSSGWILTKDNDAVALRNLQNYLSGEYTETDVWIDNIANVLDLVGIGATVRSASRAARNARAARTAENAPQATRAAPEVVDPQAPPKTPPTPSEVALAQMPKPNVRSNAKNVNRLEEEYSRTAADVGVRLNRQQVQSLNDELAALRASPAFDTSARARQIQTLNKVKASEARTMAAKEAQQAASDRALKIKNLEDQLQANQRTNAADGRLNQIEQELKAARKSASYQPAALNPIIDSIRRIDANAVVRLESPNAPGNIFQATNPSRARQAYDSVLVNESDEVAKVMFGSNATDALASGIMPQIVTESGRVMTKTPDIGQLARTRLLDEIQTSVANSTGGIEFTPKELAQTRAAFVNDFQQATGMVPNDAMTSFTFDGNNARVGAVYGTAEGGWSSAEAARDQALYALRGKGIQEGDVTILQKQGMDHVPVKFEDVRGVPGDYRVRVDANLTIDSADVQNWDALTVKRNIFDRFQPVRRDSQGSLQRWVLDAASMLDKTITGAAVTATDKAARLSRIMLKEASNFSDAYNKLPGDRKNLMMDYIKEANYKGLKQDYSDLTARGFTPDEIRTLGTWKDFWDGHYYLENLDVVRTLRAGGFGRLQTANADLFARAIPKNSTRSTVYDPSSDVVRNLSKQELDDLYVNGGTLATLRRPEDFGGTMTDTVMVRNTPTENIRALRDNDTALNYRDGYFQLTYTAPKFVDEIVRKSDGSIDYTRAVAVAGNTADAERFAAQQAANSGKVFHKNAKGSQRLANDYAVRGDEREITRGSDSFWDLNSVGGRISQRHRGQLLQGSVGMNHLGDATYIDNPIDSAIRAATSIAGRTVTRPVLNTAKERFLSQYEGFLPLDEFGRPKWPKTVHDIRAKGVVSSKEIADARTTFEYINYIENGYINGMDNTFKAMINMIGDGFHRLGASRGEQALGALAQGTNLSSLSKAAVFNAYIAANPIRQWIVQTNQVLRTFVYNPQGWATGSIPMMVNRMYGDILKGGIQNSDFGKFIESTGMLDSIDRNNLVRGTLSDAADSSNRMLNAAKKPLEVVRRVGFDTGEHVNLVGHSAAVYDRYRRAGEDVTSPEVWARMHSEARALSWDMNFAGDMPYNQTSFAVALQFAQVPHKAITQIVNRRLSRADRMKLFASDVVMWGVPASIISGILPDDFLSEHPETREIVHAGLQSWLLNTSMQNIAGDDTDVDFSSLAPFEVDGWSKFFTAVWSDGGLSDVITNSPFGQLVLKDGGRTSDFMKTASAYFMWNSEGDFVDQPELLDVMDRFARLSSGWNNYQKGMVMLKLGQARDRLGSVTDQESTDFEAYAQILGFGPSDVKDYYETSKALADNSAQKREEAVSSAKNIMQMYQMMNENDPDDVRRTTKIANLIMSNYKDDPASQEIMWDEIQKRLGNPEEQIMNKLLRAAGFQDINNLPDIVRNSPLSDASKEQALQIIQDAKNTRLTDPYYTENN